MNYEMKRISNNSILAIKKDSKITVNQSLKLIP